MQAVEQLPQIEKQAEPSWQQYLVDGVLAVAGALLVTGLIYAFQLYPRIPNISVVYLLVVLVLASTRGRYSAILASVVAFLAFDFFLVPPLYRFTINRVEEWLALFVFLAVAIITGQLAATLRQRAQEAHRRERETRILYELMRVANNEERPEQLLSAIAHAMITVFSSWGVRECALLLPDAQGTLAIQANAPQGFGQATLSPDEYATAMQVMKQGQAIGLHDVAIVPRSKDSFVRLIVHSIAAEPVARLHFIPLKTGDHVMGVMRLRIEDGLRRFPGKERPEEAQEQPNARATFFWTFVDQATSVIERARLRRESLRMEVLQRTDALRAALLSSVSHDLRTPLASIKAAASSLLQEDVQWDEETRRSFARTIEREADHLNRLVSNLLDMSRIENGALKPEKELYPVDELIRDVVERLQSLLQGRVVHTHLAADVPPVEFDYLQMDQVLTNLIENAVRYTPAGSPIDVSVERQGAQVVISVADRGPGIPTADLEHVFDKFYRVLPKQRDAKYPTGSGLGLAVCKGLVEAHGGRIWAKQREGGGAVFSVALPVGTPEKIAV